MSQLKFSSVLTKSTLLILTQCSYVKNVHMRWKTALFWWDRKLTWRSTVWNPSEVTTQNLEPFAISYKARIYLNEFKTLIKSWYGPKCKCSVCALYTWPDLLLSTLFIVLHKRLYVCVYMCIYVFMYICIYIYIHISYIIFQVIFLWFMCHIDIFKSSYFAFLCKSLLTITIVVSITEMYWVFTNHDYCHVMTWCVAMFSQESDNSCIS